MGGFCTLLQYGLYVAFLQVSGITPVASTVISYALSFIANFFLSSFFTFKTGASAKKGIGFALSHLVNLGLQTGLVAIFKGIVGSTLALLPALAICVPVNFLLVRYVFRGKMFQTAKERERINSTSINH